MKSVWSLLLAAAQSVNADYGYGIYGYGSDAAAIIDGPGGGQVCRNDDCAAQVTGMDLDSHLADCSGYFQPTVTMGVATATVMDTAITGTITETVVAATVSIYRNTTTTVSPPSMNRKAGAGALRVDEFKPDYVAVCGNLASYYSACSCAGVTSTTFTVASTTVTATETVDVAAIVTQFATSTFMANQTVSTVISCEPGYTNCNGSCVNLLTNMNNCGACGSRCVSGCANGKCLACDGPPTTCSSQIMSCSSGADCFCVGTAEGGRSCVVRNGCAGSACSTSTECPSGFVCAMDTCCQGKANICMPSPNTCPNGVATGRVFGSKMNRINPNNETGEIARGLNGNEF